jgi:hypothetical protein
MHLHLEFVKRHWRVLAYGIVGLLVLYVLYERLKAPSSQSGVAGDISGGANQVQAISAAADLQNSQVNGQIVVAQIQGQVQQVGIAAALQASLANTAAQLAATQGQTTAAEAVGLAQTSALVSIQKLQSDAAVAQTAIEGATIATLGAQRENVALHSLEIVKKQVSNIQNFSKHAGTDYTKIAPLIALELGQGDAAASLGASAAADSAAHSPAAIVSSASGIFSGLMTGLFA